MVSRHSFKVADTGSNPVLGVASTLKFEFKHSILSTKECPISLPQKSPSSRLLADGLALSVESPDFGPGFFFIALVSRCLV